METQNDVASYWDPVPAAKKLAIVQGAMLSGTSSPRSPILQTSVKSQEPAAVKTSLPIYQTARYYIPPQIKLHIYINRTQGSIHYPPPNTATTITSPHTISSQDSLISMWNMEWYKLLKYALIWKFWLGRNTNEFKTTINNCGELNL
jgi:hypothetical protein